MPPRRPSPPPTRAPGPGWRWPAAALAVALVGAGAYYWESDPAMPPLDPTRETVVFLGDSITSGHGLPLEVTFPHRLGAALGVSVRNAGVSGDLSAGGLRRLDADVLAHRPKLVVVELGANDALRRLPREETLDNLRTIVHRLRESGSGAVLVHINLAAFGSDAYREGFRRIAREEGAWLVEDFLDGVVPGLTTDGLHPTVEGHARLAARLEPVLREILGL